MTAFMLQLVPSRPPVLAEFRRVLRPGGIVAIAGWLTESSRSPPRPSSRRPCPTLASSGRRASKPGRGTTGPPRPRPRSWRRAGFRGVAAREESSTTPGRGRISPPTGETTRDRDLFEGLEPDARNRALLALERRLRALTPDQLVYRPPIVSLVGRRAEPPPCPPPESPRAASRSFGSSSRSQASLRQPPEQPRQPPEQPRQPPAPDRALRDHLGHDFVRIGQQGHARRHARCRADGWRRRSRPAAQPRSRKLRAGSSGRARTRRGPRCGGACHRAWSPRMPHRRADGTSTVTSSPDLRAKGPRGAGGGCAGRCGCRGP